ncbi:diaminobutyrate acetyltransferase [Alicyclobacillus tolerans]|uniref:diaminobutyrate acetyltransferase n=1 Tax=Alicyclobacillus tolerans TaxID=90970 RepID=UPI001F014A3C|nr:diaminobutyrate acetyltransferase [Alicyclobacillus tolerans]MCF8565251.1 diaminobutyrate acetyltransferase [Alicyclobacillus tolerans]
MADLKGIQFRKPRIEDGPEMWSLVKDVGVLDLNSPYSYLMVCKMFHETSVVAVDKAKVIGFTSAFKPPTQQDTLFVWQIGVAKTHQGRGLATAMLESILARSSCRDVHYVEATVTDSNFASQSLFKGLARKQWTQCEVSECFPAHVFPGEHHESEPLFRIGPLRMGSKKVNLKEVL